MTNEENTVNEEVIDGHPVQFERADDGTFSALAYKLQPGACVSSGNTMDEARQNIRESIVLYLEGMAEEGWAVTGLPVRS